MRLDPLEVRLMWLLTPFGLEACWIYNALVFFSSCMLLERLYRYRRGQFCENEPPRRAGIVY
jgi:hypothetical protein